jgi:ABC-type dipeptide/oligopeptide/nickel transport system permease component
MTLRRDRYAVAGGVGVAIFWIGLFLLYVVGARMGWLPLGGYGGLKFLILPALEFASGLVVIEAVFGWPGIGAQMVEAVLRFDVPLAMGTVLVAAVIVGVVNVILDVVYPLLDPTPGAHPLAA